MVGVDVSLYLMCCRVMSCRSPAASTAGCTPPQLYSAQIARSASEPAKCPANPQSDHSFLLAALILRDQCRAPLTLFSSPVPVFSTQPIRVSNRQPSCHDRHRA